jgi:dolichyl-phosphate beta-glucosyltransferase
LDSLAVFCEENFNSFEVVCVDDGSTDNTWERITSNSLPDNFRALQLTQNKGKGAAVKFGMLNATGKFRFFTDADLPYGLNAFSDAIRVFQKSHCDVVTGLRDRSRISNGFSMLTLRNTAGKIFSNLVKRLVQIESTDTQCGFKAFTEGAAVNIFTRLKTDGYAFDVEIFTIASALNLTVCDVPVSLTSHTGSKVRLSRDAFFMFKDLIEIALRVRH